MDHRDEQFWFRAAATKSLEREQNDLFSRRLAQAADGQMVRQRLMQIQVKLQMLDLEEAGINPEEQFDEDETNWLPPIKHRKKTLKDLE